MRRKHVLSIVIKFIFIGVALITVSCAVNPVTGHPNLMLISQEDEIKLGRQTDTDVIKEYGIRVRSISRATTIENALRSLGVPDHRLKDMVVLNGGTTGQSIPANTLLKVVEYGR
jgi:hypothetical protein